MRSWGAGAFENDMAMTWLGELTRENAVGPVVEALEAVVGEDSVVDERCGCEALAAAELVAALNPAESAILPDDVNTWLKRQKLEPTAQLLRLARAAVTRIQGNASELRASWELAARGGREWMSMVEELSTRLDYDAGEGSTLSSRWWRLW
jgi:hypothetical protein